MNTSNDNRIGNLWLLAGTTVAVASLTTIMLAPKIVSATMGCGGDGIGQFIFSLLVGGSGIIVLLVSCVMLLLLSLIAWIN